MIIYRDAWRDVDATEAVAGCAAALRVAARGHEAATRLLIDWGEIAAGLADAMLPDEDDLPPALETVHAAGMAVARVVQRAAGAGDAAAEAGKAVRRVAALDLPARLRLRVPEGFAYYALYPDTYAAAAAALAREGGEARATVIGLRSIGATLGALAAAVLAAEGWEVRSLTLRPRGHPFERRPVLSRALAAWLAARPGLFLVVDEGPGLSGSSLCGTAEVLAELGIAEERIVLMPSWLPDPAGFASPAARARWLRHRKVVGSFDEVVAPRVLPAEAIDLSAGAWRGHVFRHESEWPAVHPQHERRKALHVEGGPAVFKFAGLGRYGASRHLLAERLADRGLAPPVLGFGHGFLRTRFVAGRPLSRRDLDRDLMGFAAAYMAERVALSPVREQARLDELMAMTESNVRLGLGARWLAPLAKVAASRSALESAMAVAVDGRVQPHEWLRLPGGFTKTDAVDHHDDHFFPGSADIAWDVAGFGAEFALSPDQVRELSDRVDPGLARRLPFYAVAYLAFRLGYAVMAERSLGSASDGRRFARLRPRYARQLKAALQALDAVG